MKNKPVWTLEGQVLNILGVHNLSQADKMVISGICQEFEREFVNGSGDRRVGPDYQEADVVIKKLAGMGYEAPLEYRQNKEEVLLNLIDEIADEGGKKDIDGEHKAFLNRRNGRLYLEREGD